MQNCRIRRLFDTAILTDKRSSESFQTTPVYKLFMISPSVF
ncbi:hypothetical protein HMPREF1051_0725 [Neisseria sicca VK64]|uniref:Uncharacterized protein n=1 Tax=Neisseria sicca VK64 TaxID=1095748 RepID=I2NQH7_NEISI|nr:hypothetical protein HMPREF1051_0725 [Neisseria sicca VK64]